jgi:hypothetical protein
VAIPTVNRNLPWDEIRRAWQTTRTSMAALAAKYGIGSVTTLKRRRTDEGWKRDADVAAAKPSPAAVIADATALPGVAKTSGAPPTPGGGQPRGTHQPGPREPVATRPAPADRDAAGAGVMGSAEQLILDTPLERLRETSFARQMAGAAVVQKTALLLLRRLAGVLQPPSHEMDGVGGGQEPDTEALGNLQRLIRINPDRETLAGLIAAGVKAYEVGVAMERRALADPVVKPVDGDKERAAPVQRNGGDLLRFVDPATAEKMRLWAKQIARERREAEIAAAKG